MSDRLEFKVVIYAQDGLRRAQEIQDRIGRELWFMFGKNATIRTPAQDAMEES